MNKNKHCIFIWYVEDYFLQMKLALLHDYYPLIESCFPWEILLHCVLVYLSKQHLYFDDVDHNVISENTYYRQIASDSISFEIDRHYSILVTHQYARDKYGPIYM